MNIPIKLISKKSGRIVEATVSPRFLLDVLDEDDLITQLTMCGCEPIGETNYIECNCDEEWHDTKVLIGDEIT